MDNAGSVGRFERCQHRLFLRDGGPEMKSTVVKRSVKIDGRTTSVSLEDAFWRALKEIAGSRNMTLAELATSINAKREHANLSSAIRLFILNYFRIPINEETGARNALPNVETARPARPQSQRR
jgi:predicted DNA-binding ribbon-helix-helix protein